MGTNERKWIIKAAGNAEKSAQLAAELGIDRVLADLLVQRGVETFEEARAFFRPRLEDLHDPFLMKDMDKAVERIHQAVTSAQKILVYGATSTSVSTTSSSLTMAACCSTTTGPG